MNLDKLPLRVALSLLLFLLLAPPVSTLGSALGFLLSKVLLHLVS